MFGDIDHVDAHGCSRFQFCLWEDSARHKSGCMLARLTSPLQAISSGKIQRSSSDSSRASGGWGARVGPEGFEFCQHVM